MPFCKESTPSRSGTANSGSVLCAGGHGQPEVFAQDRPLSPMYVRSGGRATYLGLQSQQVVGVLLQVFKERVVAAACILHLGFASWGSGAQKDFKRLLSSWDLRHAQIEGKTLTD